MIWLVYLFTIISIVLYSSNSLVKSICLPIKEKLKSLSYLFFMFPQNLAAFYPPQVNNINKYNIYPNQIWRTFESKIFFITFILNFLIQLYKGERERGKNSALWIILVCYVRVQEECNAVFCLNINDIIILQSFYPKRKFFLFTPQKVRRQQ